MRVSEPITTSAEQRTCSCGAVFDVILTKIGGKALPGAPRFCPDCLAASDLWGPVKVDDRADGILHSLSRVGVNVRQHGGCTLDGWEADEGAVPVVAAREFLADTISAGWADPVRGLFLTGDTGTGKTHLSVAIIREALLSPRVDPHRVVFDRVARLITEIQDTYGTGNTEKVLAKRERAQLWVLDDLGAEKATEDVLRILTDLFSAREGHPTVITSNLTPDSLAGRWTSEGWARLSSRLASQNFRAVAVRGRDRRFA